MFVSVEVITVIACAVSIIVAFMSACGWVLNRMDARLDARFVAQEARMDARFATIDGRFDRLDDRMSGVEHELSEVKIAVARLEGPQTRLLTSR